ncbi:MAG: DUF433 domain-containing protein [Hydrogenophilales bacterium]|nr:DUF433 domain-containing protein [Hydrogenophilales bacterium]
MQHRWKERISSNPGVLAGKPVVAGTRISVELLLDCLAGGWGVNEVVEAYPHIAPEDVLAALAFSADVLRRKPYITVPEVEESAGGENDDNCLRA